MNKDSTNVSDQTRLGIGADRSARKRNAALGVSLATLIATISSGSALAATQAADAPAEANDTAVENSDASVEAEEIVVTAQKRGAESVTDVPISVAVLGGTQLEESGARGVSEALNNVGGVNLTEAEPGRATISIRGAAAGGPTLTGSSPVGYYLDELPFSFITNAILPDVNAFDLERIEVLRGPQGTLYGASSLNGVVRILTNDANLNEFEAKGRLRVGFTENSDDSYSGDLAINIPIIPGKLAIRGVASYADVGGFISTATTPDFNDSKIRNFRVKVNARPVEDLNIDFGVWISRLDNDGPSEGLDDYTTPFSDDQKVSRDYEAYNFIVAYDFSSFSIQSSTGYIDLRGEGALDFNIGGGFTLNLIDNLSAKVFTHEDRFVTKFDGPWNFSGGFFYRSVNQLLNQAVPAFFAYPLEFTDKSRSFAVFGEVNRSLWDEKINLTGGIRYFRDKVTTQERSTLFAGTAGPLVSAESRFEAVTWRAVASYFPTKDLTLYGSIATGFRSGFNQNPLSLAVEPNLPPVDSDDLITYEVGFKGALLRGALTFDTAFYYTDWKGSQQYTLTSLGSVAVVNAAGSSGFGADASVTVRPTDRLSFNASVGWNDLRFDDTVFQNGVPLLPKGDRMNYSPAFTAGFGGEYRFPIGGDDLHGFAAGNVRYTSKQILHDVVGDVLVITESDRITNAGLRAGVEASSWGLQAFVDNLTNERGSVTPASTSTPTTARLRPRTIGLQLSFKY